MTDIRFLFNNIDNEKIEAALGQHVGDVGISQFRDHGPHHKFAFLQPLSYGKHSRPPDFSPLKKHGDRSPFMPMNDSSGPVLRAQVT